MRNTAIRVLMVLTMVGGVSLLGLVRVTEPTPSHATESWDVDTATDRPTEPVIVTAPDGTVTVNQPQPDGTVVGSVTLPSGETFTFPGGGIPAPERPAGAVTGCGEGQVMAEDMTCVPTSFYAAPAPADVIHEDDPRWDCRTMGNRECGVTIQGQAYVVTFVDGQPASVRGN